MCSIAFWHEPNYCYASIHVNFRPLVKRISIALSLLLYGPLTGFDMFPLFHNYFINSIVSINN